MSRLGGISGKIAIKKFYKLGYIVVRQHGSHVRMRHFKNTKRKPITVPDHKELKIGLLKQLIKDVGVTENEFLDL